MRTDRPIVDPRLPRRIQRFFPSTCILQERVDAQNPIGEWVPTWTDKHTAPCRFAAGPTFQPQPTSEGIVTIRASHRAMLIGDFHDVRPDTWRAMIDGVAYDVVSVDWGEGAFTMLEMQMRAPERTNA